MNTNKHAKCVPVARADLDAEAPTCTQCQKDGIPCTRTLAPFKFSLVSSNMFGGPPRKSLKIPKKLVYVDETAELAACYSHEDNENIRDSAILSSPHPSSWSEIGQDAMNSLNLDRDRELSMPPGFFQHNTDFSNSNSQLSANYTTKSRRWSTRQEAYDGGNDNYNDDSEDTTAALATDTEASRPRTGSRASDISFLSPNPLNQNETPKFVSSLSSTSSLMSGVVKLPSTGYSSNGVISSLGHNTLEYLLLRYYIEHLSLWFDISDPERQFELIVPQRAKRCQALMNAILATSARHLTRVPRYRTTAGTIEYKGRILPGLTDETALHYHSKCINDLLILGADPEQNRNEDLLAAGVILRLYEEFDYPFRDEQKDNELFLQMLNAFIEAQIPNYAVPSISGADSSVIISSPNTATNTNSNTQSEPPQKLRQAVFLIAFRQELYSAFLKQRPFNMSMSRCDVFRTFEPAEDAVWTTRLVIFCADVLNFCYGNNGPSEKTGPLLDTELGKEKWLELKELEKMWVKCLPSTFEPIYYREPERQKGEIFPEICYLTSLHAAGVQHVELARILLYVNDPTQPKFGFGQVARMRILNQKLKDAVLRLCGIAVNSKRNPPAFTTAMLSIAACGELFEDELEHRALLSILDELEYNLGWPFGNLREKLQQAWQYGGHWESNLLE